MEKGETKYGYTLAAENFPFPYFWYRIGVSDISNLGFRVGIPIYGSGLDYSRVLYKRDNKWDILNIAWSLNPNNNIDLTYYKFNRKEREGKQPMLTWWGIRGMFIPKGIMGESSTRVGLLLGGNVGAKIGYEIGYFHDFSSMPITDLFDANWRWDTPENRDRYGDTPHIDPASGLPSEYSRLTGISFQLFYSVK